MGKVRSIINACKLKKDYFFYCTIVCLTLLAVLLLSQGNSGGNPEKIISTVVIGTVIFLLLFYNMMKEKIHLFAFSFIMLMGGLSLLIQPIFNIPDEQVHFKRAEWVSRGNFIVDTSDQYFEVIKTCQDFNDERFETYTQSETAKEDVNNDLISVQNIASTNFSLFYLPQAFGIIVAKVLNFKAIWLIWAGRFVNLLCYAFLSCIAIKIAPRLKFLLFFVASLPISIQQAASFSIDASINGLAILLIALFLKLYFVEEKTLNSKELVLFWVVSLLLTLAKVTDIFLAGLFLLIPLKNFKTNKRGILSKCILVGSIILSGLIFYYYTTTFATNLEVKEFLGAADIDSVTQIKYILSQPIKWLSDFCNSMLREVNGYIRMLNTFGCLEYEYSILTPITIFMFAKISYQDQGISLDRFKKFLIVLMIVGIYAASCLALYLSWTPVGADYISGIQGRYFIPIIAAGGMIISSNNTKKIDDHLGDIAVICGMVGTMLIVTATRYY